jgi:hypothetical protein
MLDWLRTHNQRKQARRDRALLEPRARRLLDSYLAADGPRKQRFYQVVAGAAAACSPEVSDPALDTTRHAAATAFQALQVVKSRVQKKLDGDELQSLITDAYAVVAVASNRAALTATMDEETLRLGTAAVHLITMATSFVENSGAGPM